MIYHDYFSSKLSLKTMGYTKRNKRCIPKEGMPHAHKACQKKRGKRKDSYPKKVCHMPLRHDKKKNKIQPIPKILQGERNHMKEFLHHPPKISTHLHILIKVYDLFLIWIQPLTQQNMRSMFAIVSSIPTDPPKRNNQKQDGKERHTKRPW